MTTEEVHPPCKAMGPLFLLSANIFITLDFFIRRDLLTVYAVLAWKDYSQIGGVSSRTCRRISGFSWYL